MFPTLSLLLAIQGSGPVLPPGVTPEFQSELLKAAKLLDDGQFTAAAKALQSFPSSEISIQWDESGVPSIQRQTVLDARASAFLAWNQVAPSLKFKVADSAPLRISFSKQNAIDPKSRQIRPVIITRSGPAVQAVVSLTRGETPTPATGFDIQASIVQAVGSYLGVSALPYGVSALVPTEASSTRPAQLNKFEGAIATSNIEVVAELKKAADEKKHAAFAVPNIVPPAGTVHVGSVYRGDVQHFEVEIKNTGRGAGKFWIRPDCGCTIAPGVLDIPAGATVKVPITFTTEEFKGFNERKLYIISNDPKKPVGSIPFDVTVNLPYEFASPDGNVIILGDGEQKGEVFLTFNGREPFAIKQVTINGLQIPVTYEPWSGTLPNSDSREKKEGYRFELTYPAFIPPGRTTSGLAVVTDSAKWPLATYTFSVQKGIVALPDELYLGKLSGVKTAKVLVSRPGRPFRVVSAKSDSVYFTVEIDPASASDETTLIVKYNANAPSGRLEKTITIQTDDPKQPTLKVPITATVE
jgi:hypothetical protein